MSHQDSKVFSLNVSSSGDSAYVRFPNHPGAGKKGVAAKQIDLMSDFRIGKDIRIIVDLDINGEAIGVEIITYD